MRVYIPITFEQLLEPALKAKIGVAPTEKFSAQFNAETDIEFIEDCAFTQASILGFLNLKKVSTKIKGRFIVSANIDEKNYIEDEKIAGKVNINIDIPWNKIVCIHCEDIDEIPIITELLNQNEQHALKEIDTICLLWFEKNERQIIIDTYKKL